MSRPCWDLDVPIAYLICTNDRALPCSVQEAMIERVKRGDWLIERCDTGHCPFLSRPQVVVHMIDQISKTYGSQEA